MSSRNVPVEQIVDELFALASAIPVDRRQSKHCSSVKPNSIIYAACALAVKHQFPCDRMDQLIEERFLKKGIFLIIDNIDDLESLIPYATPEMQNRVILWLASNRFVGRAMNLARNCFDRGLTKIEVNVAIAHYMGGATYSSNTENELLALASETHSPEQYEEIKNNFLERNRKRRFLD